jgi:hypothetical protein
MTPEIEISVLDLRYESCRMKDPQLEGRLLSSIAERGIEQPLEGVAVEEGGQGVLLNGFKRYRCARKLGKATVPYTVLGGDAVMGILNLLRPSHTKALNILEQARFIDELAKGRAMSVAEIASELSRSKAWVSMRLGLVAQMSPAVSEELFAGRFPVYSYMYTLRPFMRMNGNGAVSRENREDVDAFVKAVSGKNLSVREIEQLAHGFFRGPVSFRQEILAGNVALSLEQVAEAATEAAANADVCSEFERLLLKDLELTGKYMQRVMGKSRNDSRLKSPAFFAQSHLLSAGILSRSSAFIQSIRELHDRSGQA